MYESFKQLQDYTSSIRSRTYYRKPAYLFTTDTTGPIETLIQAYFDRWQIEVNHRDTKHFLGVGQAQVWSKKSVPRQPAFAVAVYSLLILVGLNLYGPNRTDDFIPLPRWRKSARGPSTLDLVSLLRNDVIETHFSDTIQQIIPQNMPKNAIKYAYV